MTNAAFTPVLLDLLRQAHRTQNAFFQQLPAVELSATGTPELWSAKDHVAHLTFWRQRLTYRLQAIIHHEPQPHLPGYERLNPLIFQAHRTEPWPQILAASDQTYAELMACTALVGDDDLLAWGRFDWVGDGMPLYTTFMGNCYEHTQNHLAQYLLDRQEDVRALMIQEEWASRVVEAGVPDALKGYMLYNLACFYATHGRVEKAQPALQQALTLYPAVWEWVLTDPDLVALPPSLAD
jgi:tetratricopeptide (TPR) repeat protein